MGDPPGGRSMRYTENERYYTAESTITWPLDPLIQQPPRFSLSLLSHGTRPLINQTNPDYPRLPQTTSELYRTSEHCALCRFPWTRLQQILPPRRRRPFPPPAPQQLPMRMLPSLIPGRPRRRRSPGGHALRKVWPCLCAMPLLHRSFLRLRWAPRSTTTAACTSR